jgi:hypothetical protein
MATALERSGIGVPVVKLVRGDEIETPPRGPAVVVGTLAAAHNWPERYRPFLGEMRVRLGQGPSGEAASGRRVMHVPDVFADDALAEWQDVARELGFRAIVALPLQTKNRVIGAAAFYFAQPVELNTGEHGLLRTVTDQMVRNRFVVEVGDTQALNGAVSRLRNIDGVFDAYRVTPSG